MIAKSSLLQLQNKLLVELFQIMLTKFPLQLYGILFCFIFSITLETYLVIMW